ncbi:MAG: cbb3-type cytochrome oxidase assembly protein CcoS [Planctomycetota bacterium]
MSVIFIALPIALLLAALAVAGFVTTVTEGQYDDLETPPHRMLCDDLEAHVVRHGEDGNTESQRMQSEEGQLNRGVEGG